MAMTGAERQAKYASNTLRRRREELIAEMGGACNYCGVRHGEYRDDIKIVLEFNHLKPRTWRYGQVKGGVSTTTALRLYREEWEQRILNLACPTCNKRLGPPDTTVYTEPDEDGLREW